MIFTSNDVLVQLSSDPFGISMSLVAHEIYSVDQNCLLVSDLAVQPKDQTQSFATRETLPYGYNNDIELLKSRCLEYINTVSKCPLNTAETIIGDTSGIIWEVLRATCRFEQVNPVAKKASTHPSDPCDNVRSLVNHAPEEPEEFLSNVNISLKGVSY